MSTVAGIDAVIRRGEESCCRTGRVSWRAKLGDGHSWQPGQESGG